jgi:hypothetical protein
MRGLGHRPNPNGGFMRKNLVVLSLVAAFTLIASFGFAGSRAAMRITVPFDFYAGNQQLPAGEYTFEMASGLTQTGSLVTIRTQKGVGMCMLVTHPGKDAIDSKLLFNKYGDNHFLSSVSILGFTAGVKMHKLERELRAQFQKQKDVVIIAQK